MAHVLVALIHVTKLIEPIINTTSKRCSRFPYFSSPITWKVIKNMSRTKGWALTSLLVGKDALV